MSTTKIKINYVIVNGGDGSASVHFCKNNHLAEIYDKFSQQFERWGEPEDFEEELEFDEHGELLDKYCVNVKEALEERINDKWTNEKHPEMVKECKKWLLELEEAEQNKKRST